MARRENKVPRVVRVFYWMDNLHKKAYVLSRAVFIGIWLGLLSRKTLHALDRVYYDRQTAYRTDRHNLRGLNEWERKAIDQFFAGRKKLLVGAAGGGREVLAFHKLGFEVDAFECHPDLVQFASDFLRRHGVSSTIELVGRDDVPGTERKYDGLILGWGAYMLIQGRENRIAFLKRLRDRGTDDAPIMLSFFDRGEDLQRFRLVALVGNTIRWIRRGDRIQEGDTLVPNYVHFFTESEIRQELAEAGYHLVHYSRDEYGHAVAAPAERPVRQDEAHVNQTRSKSEVAG